MCRWLFNRKGQNTAEYAILIGLVVAAAIAMQTYVKRGLQGRLKDGVDELAENTAQYEPYYVDSDFETTQSHTEEHSVKTGGSVTKEVTADSYDRTGIQKILEVQE